MSQTRDLPAIDVLLPARDEAAALPYVLRGWPPALRAIVVDNGSTDGTAEVARRLGATVVTETRAGYGAAVHTGLLASTASLVAVMDADGSMDHRDVLRLAAPVAAGEADLVVGRRRPVGRGVWPWHARVGNAVVAQVLRAHFELPVHDIGPLRVARRTDLLALDVRDRRFGYPLETLVRAAQDGWRVIELDISYGPRASGTKSKVTGSLGGTARALSDFRRVLACTGR